MENKSNPRSAEKFRGLSTKDRKKEGVARDKKVIAEERLQETSFVHTSTSLRATDKQIKPRIEQQCPDSHRSNRGSATATSICGAKRRVLTGAGRRHEICFLWGVAARGLCGQGPHHWLAWLPRGDGTAGTGRPCHRAKNWRLSCRNNSFAGRIRSGASGAFAAFGP